MRGTERKWRVSDYPNFVIARGFLPKERKGAALFEAGLKGSISERLINKGG